MARDKKPDEIFCRACGITIKKEAEHCPECGTRNTSVGPQEPAVAKRRSPPARQSPTAENRGPDQPPKSVSTPDNSAVDAFVLYAGWISGAFLLLMGISTFLDSGSIIRRLLSGIVFVTGGVVALPISREHIQPKVRRYGISLTRALIVGIVIFALFVGTLLAP